MTVVHKQPSAQLRYEIRFEGIADGQSIATIDAVTVTARGLAAGPALTIAEQTAAGTSLYLKLTAGADGESYLVTAKVTDTGGESHEGDVEAMVLDLAWTAPDGGSAYLTALDYVARFGLSETVALTDEAGSGRIDRQALFAALDDAVAEIDSYLARRYATPVAATALLKTIAGDLARWRLHANARPDAVEANAAAARRHLRDLADGRAALPGASPKTEGQDTPLSEAPDRTFTRESLEGF